MGCLLTSDIKFCDFSTGGLKKVYLTNKEFILGVNFLDDNEAIISDFITSKDVVELWWLDFDINDTTTSISETLEESSKGKLFTVSLDTTFIMMEPEKRNTLSEMIDGKMVAVVQDTNGLYWCLGEEDGLEVSSYGAGTESAGGVNSYRLQLTGYQRHQIREVDLAAVSSFWVAVEDCSIYAGLPIASIPPPLAPIFDCLIDFSN